MVALIVLIRWFGVSLTRWYRFGDRRRPRDAKRRHSNRGSGVAVGVDGAAEGCPCRCLSWPDGAA